ncbi:hypothetical protein JST97_37755 [bacterium]|nr:hypothetical protein [bacterium]
MIHTGNINPVIQMLPQLLQMGMPLLQQASAPMSGMGADQFSASPGISQQSLGALPNFANSLGSPAGAAPAAGANQTGPAAGGGGGGAAARAVDIAKQFEGQDSKSIKGKLPGFTAPGGNTNNCAAFVSACLEHTGALPKGGGSASVSSLRGKLKSAGWKKVPGNQAPKGSVWMTKEGKGSHTELVASAGGTQTIGSNNVRQGFQKIKTRQKNASSGEFYAPPNG